MGWRLVIISLDSLESHTNWNFKIKIVADTTPVLHWNCILLNLPTRVFTFLHSSKFYQIVTNVTFDLFRWRMWPPGRNSQPQLQLQMQISQPRLQMQPTQRVKIQTSVMLLSLTAGIVNWLLVCALLPLLVNTAPYKTKNSFFPFQASRVIKYFNMFDFIQLQKNNLGLFAFYSLFQFIQFAVGWGKYFLPYLFTQFSLSTLVYFGLGKVKIIMFISTLFGIVMKPL